MRNQYLLLVGVLIASGCVNEASVVSNVDGTTDESVIGGDISEAPEVKAASNQQQESKMASEQAPAKYNELSDFERYVIEEKGTEYAFKGEYTDTDDPGTYICRRCNAKLYKSDHKFHSHCGWPAFDDEIEGAVKRTIDADGYRVEITCANCDGHLGHVFEGEQLTDKNIRHCVNSVSMIFVPEGKEIPPTIKLAE